MCWGVLVGLVVSVLGLGGSLWAQPDAATPAPTWQRLTVGLFRVYYQRDVVAAERTGRVAWTLYQQIDRRFSLRPDRPLALWLAETDASFAQVSGTPIVDWARGFAFPERLEAVVRVPSGSGRLEALDRLVRHEVAHLCLGVLAGRGEREIPRWFHEGFAMYVSERWDVLDDLRLALYSVGDRLIPLDRLERGFPVDSKLAELAYVESFHAVRTLVLEHSFTQLTTLLARLRAGEPFPEAFERTYGITVAMFALDWQAAAQSSTRWIFVGAGLALLGVGFSPILVCGFWRRRRAQRSILARWQEEEEKPDSFYR